MLEFSGEFGITVDADADGWKNVDWDEEEESL